MKTITLPSHLKAFIFALTLLPASFTMQQVYAQAAMLTTMPATTNHTAVASIGFQSAAFPVGSTGKVKVIFIDPTGNGAFIVVRDKNKNIIHSNHYKNEGSYKSNLDLSPLPDGEYTVEVIALTKAGFNKQKYSYTFQIRSTTNRSLTPLNKELEKSLFTPRHYQVRH